MKWWNSLRTKIIAWSFVPTAIILLAVAWFTFYSYQRVVGDLAIKQELADLNSKTEQAAIGINSLINNSLRPVILNIDIKPELPREIRAQNILDQANLDIFDGGTFFVDERGIVYKTQSKHPALIGQDWSDTYQFRFVRDNPPGAGPITDIRSIGNGGEGIACVIWPMHNSQLVFIGASYFCLDITPNEPGFLYNSFKDLSLGSNVTILDGNQHILYSPDITLLGKDLSKDASIQQLIQSGSQSMRYQNRAVDKVISYSPMVRGKNPNTFWVFVSEKSWNEIMQPTLPYRQLLLFLLALGVIVPVLVTAYGVRHITEPIQKLIKAAEQVTAGKFKHRIEVKTGDEIETLADQFNLMSAELDESYSSLEKKVADRTRELAVMNSILSVASRSLDIHEILNDSLKIIIERLYFLAGWAYQFGPDLKSPLPITQQGSKGVDARILINILAPLCQGDFAKRSSKIKVIDVKDLGDEKLRGKLTRAGIQTLVNLPLKSKGRILGCLVLAKHPTQQGSNEELSLLGSIGQQIGVAMDIAQLYEQAEKTAVTAERSRLARELHDAVTQTLFSANIIADVIPRIWKRDPEEGMRNLEELRELTRGALAEMRTMLLEMRPESLERAELKTLLNQLADAFLGRVRVPVSLVIEGICEPGQEVKIVFYRVAQEALNNIAKHSGARQVDLRLECKNDQLSLLIKDNGLGFDPATVTSEHLGMAIMRERASSIGAKIKIDSKVGQGTVVEMVWKPAREG